jgi:GntR family transcriptional regulator, rspAB operon transcriptional repressor
MSILPISALSPVSQRPQSLTDQIHERMREEILNATWRPGDIVIEPELAARYGVSKTPVREALRLLSQEGWIVTMPRKGYLVRPLRLNDVREVFELRLLLEPGLLAKAAREASSASMDDLKKLVEAEQQVGHTDDSPNSVGREFHIAAVRLGSNDRAVAVVGGLLNEIRRLHHLLPGEEAHGSAAEVVADHLAIIEAMSNRDADKVYALSRDHIESSATRLTNAFRLGGG